MFIDVHAHLNDKRLYPKIDELRKKYQDAKVGVVINAGFDINSSYLAKDIAEKYSECYFVAGVHPDDAKNYNAETDKKLRELCRHEKCVGVGETGLDYYYDGDCKDEQKFAFLSQLTIAKEMNLPLVVHSRDATEDTFEIIKQNAVDLKRGFLLHCYSGSIETAREYAKLGGYFSFGGVATFKNGHKADIVRSIPIDRIFTETDCPYMSPEPYRGTENEPKYIPVIADKLAEFYGITVDEFTTAVAENAERFFQIDIKCK